MFPPIPFSFSLNPIATILRSLFFYAPRTSTITQTRGAGTPTETRATVATVTNNDDYLVTVLSNELREEGARRVYNLCPTPSASVAVAANKTITATVGVYVVSMGAGTGTLTFTGTATGSTGTLVASASARTSAVLTITVAGTIIATASVATCVDIQFENVTAQTTQTAGEYVSVGVPSDWAGTELVTNGTFDSGTTGWAAAVGATLSIDTNRLKITNDGTGANAGEAQQAITTVAGAKYVLYATGTAGTISPSIKVGTTAGAQDLLTNSAFTGFNSFTFTATGTTSYVSIRANAVTASGTVFFDDVGVKPAYYHGAGVDGVRYFDVDINGNPIV